MVARRGSKHCRRHVSCRLELSLTVRTCLEQGCHRTVRSISIHPRYCSVWYCTYVGGEVRGSGEVKGGGGGGRWQVGEWCGRESRGWSGEAIFCSTFRLGQSMKNCL